MRLLNLGQKLNRTLAALLSSAMVMTSFTVPVMADEPAEDFEVITQADETGSSGAEEVNGESEGLTVYYHYDHTQLNDGEYIAASPWPTCNMSVVSANTVNVKIGDWSGDCYEFSHLYADWWQLDLKQAPSDGFALYLVGPDNVSLGKLSEYDSQWNNPDIYSVMTSEDTNAIALDGAAYYVNDVAAAYVSQVTMYIYDESENLVPGLYLWAKDGEGADATYPLEYVDTEDKTIKELTPSVNSVDGDNLYALTDASDEMGENWYKITFIVDLSKTGKAFIYDRFDGTDIDWHPGTTFSYDGYQDVDASVMLTEGKVCYKNGEFIERHSLLDLRNLVEKVNKAVESDYTPGTWTDFSAALVSANEVLEKADYKAVLQENADKVTGEDIDDAFSGLTKAYENLVKVVSLAMLRELVETVKDYDADSYTAESFGDFSTALLAAQTLLAKDDYKGVSDTDAADVENDEIKKAYDDLKAAADKLETIAKPLTLYFYCARNDVPENGFLGATLWHEGDLVAKEGYEPTTLLWGNKGYVLNQVAGDWWELELTEHPSATVDAGFELDVFNSSTESVKVIGKYGSEYEDIDTYAYFADNDNTYVALKGDAVYLNDEATALIKEAQAGKSLAELRELVSSTAEFDENEYTVKSWSNFRKALVSANEILNRTGYKELTDEEAKKVVEDDITEAFAVLLNAKESLIPDMTVETIYYRYDHTDLEEGQYLAVSPWAQGNITPLEAEEVNVDCGTWSSKCYKLDRYFADWWNLGLAEMISGGFSLYLVGPDNVRLAELSQYDSVWHNTDIYSVMTDEGTNAIALDGAAYYVNDVATAYVSQVTMYIYDESENLVPGLYLWAKDGEGADATYPLKYVDTEDKTIKELTPDFASEGNNLYALTDASEEIGANWYKITFIVDLSKTGKAFIYDRFDGTAIDWNPGTKFGYDGSQDVDASVMLTEGKVFYKDGEFSDVVATTLIKLRDLVKTADALNAEDYEAESFASMQKALTEAKAVLSDYAALSDSEAGVTTGDNIESAYAALKRSLDSLVKLFKADKTVKVFYYSEDNWDGLYVMVYDDIRDFMQNEAPVHAVDGHPGWYTFTLVMDDEIETITADSDLWPGFQICAADWSNSVMTIAEGATYDIYKALVIDSKDGDELYVKDGKIYSSFDGAEKITIEMLLELIEEAENYSEADFTADSFAVLKKVLAEAKAYAEATLADPGNEDAAKTAEMYNKLLDTMNALKYSTMAGINVKKVALNDDFITGADLSSFVAVRQSGVVFKADTNGDGVVEALSDQQFFNYLKEGGTNWVRIRIWNDPYDSSGNGYGGGNNDVNKAVILSKLAQNAGMKILIDFHYSDFWADPAKYKAPKAWADMTNKQKADALYEFTYDTLETLHNAGIKDIYMVQVGNESNHGIAGETDNDATILYGYGCEAVHDAARDLYGHDIDAAVHFTDVQNGGGTVTGSMERQVVNRTYKSHADGTEQYVPYDAVGVSYYPMYNHGSISNLKTVLKALKAGYGPGGSPTKVYVAETSWAWTWLDGDGYHNSGPSISGGQDVTSYSISVQGQADELRAVVDAVNSVNEDKDDLSAFGVFYWESAWLSPYQACYDDYSYDAENYKLNQTAWETYGSGWASKYSIEYDPTDAGLYYGGVGVDNMGWFNFDGTALDTARIFKLIRSGASTDKKKVVAVQGNQKIILNVGTDAEIDDILPSTVPVYYNDGSEDVTPVIWNKDEKKKIDLDEAGIYEINGKAKVEGVVYVVKLTVEVVANNSIPALKNNDFESIQYNTNNNVKFYNWDVYGVNEDGTYVTYITDTDGTDNTKYFNWGTNNITINNENAKGDTKNGHALNFWHGDSPMDIHIYQKIGTAKEKTSFIPGSYTYGGYLEGGSAGKYDKQYAVAYVYDSEAAFDKDLEATKLDPVKHPLGTDAKRYKASTQFAGWLSWQEVKVEDVKVNPGQYLVVGFEMNGSTAGAWGSVDDAYLYGTFNVNVAANTGSGKGLMTASRYVAGTGEKVKLTAKSEKGSKLNTITVEGEGVSEDYFRKEFANGKTAWTVKGTKAVYTATDKDNESATTTIYFSMPEGDVTVTADFENPFVNGAVDISDKEVIVSLNGLPEDSAAFYLHDKKVNPGVTLRYKGYTLADKDYKVKYGKNNAIGDGTLTITGKKPNFTGTRSVTFKIVEDKRTKIASVEFVKPDLKKNNLPSYYYTGSPITFVDKAVDPDSIYAIEVKDADGKTVSANEYILGYTKNTKVGKATLFVSAKADSAVYCGSFSKSFNVAKADIGKLIVEGNPDSRMVVNDTNRIADVEFVKEGAKPSVQIWYDKTVNLRNKKDYKVTYKNNRKVSTDKKKAKVVIKGKGNYTGKATLTLNIKPMDITDSNMLVQVEDLLEGKKLNPKTVLMKKTGTKKIAKQQYKVSVYEVSANTLSSNTISVNQLGAEVTGQTADASKYYAVRIDGQKDLTGTIIRNLRVADKDHMVTASSVKLGTIFYQAGAIRLDKNNSGTLKVDSTGNKAVSVNCIRVSTGTGATVLNGDQFEIYLYKQKAKDNITSSGSASIYVRVKDGARAADGKLLAGDVVKKFKVKKLKLVSLDTYRSKISSNSVMGYAAINHESANTPVQITDKTNLFDVMDEDTTYGKEQYYTGYEKNPGYSGASAGSEGLRILINGNEASMPFIDYKLTYSKNERASKISKSGEGITYGGQNKEDPVPYTYVKGSGAQATFTGTTNYSGTVRFLDAFYIRPRTVDDLEVVSVNSVQYSGKALLDKVKYVKFIDPRYGVEDFMKRGKAYTLKVKNINMVSGVSGNKVPYLVFTAKNDLVGSKNKNTMTWNFALSSRKLTEANTTIEEIKPQKYKYGVAVEPKLKVKCNGKQLSQNKDYILEYSNNHDKCSTVDADGFEYDDAPTVRIIGIGNYTGELTRTFVIK